MAEGSATSRRYRLVTCSLFQMFFQLAGGLAYGCPYGRNVTQRIQQTKIMDQAVIPGHRHIHSRCVELTSERFSLITKHVKLGSLDQCGW